MKKFILEMLPFMALFAMLVFASCKGQEVKSEKQKEFDKLQETVDREFEMKGKEVAYFASGCFWCYESIYESIDGVDTVISGYGGGTMKNPTYRNHGSHAEVIKVVYRPTKVSYSVLLKAFVETTNLYTYGQAPDFGSAYRSVLFPDGLEQNNLVKALLDKHKGHKVEVVAFDKTNFTRAEEYHQDYVCRLQKGEDVVNKSYGLSVSVPRLNEFKDNTKIDLKRKLTKFQKQILRSGHTESPFTSPLNREKRSGVYVSAETGDTLFVSKAKFKSGTGWPSFDDATDKVSIGRGEQGGHEVIEKSTGGHLGHLFQGEGFTEKNKRYCINGSILDFKPIKE